MFDWEKWIEEHNNEDGYYNPATQEELDLLVQDIEKSRYLLEEEYLNFLRLSNGFSHNGVLIFSTKNDIGSGIGFIEFNDMYKDFSGGESNLEIYLQSGSVIWAKQTIEQNIVYGEFEMNDGVNPLKTYDNFIQMVLSSLSTYDNQEDD